MKKGDKLKIEITHQGAPVVNDGFIIELGKNVCAVSIDMKSKYCQTAFSISGSNGECGIVIVTTEESLHLKKGVHRDDPTHLEFPQFKGWDVFASGIGRYTLRICFTKK